MQPQGSQMVITPRPFSPGKSVAELEVLARLPASSSPPAAGELINLLPHRPENAELRSRRWRHPVPGLGRRDFGSAVGHQLSLRRSLWGGKGDVSGVGGRAPQEALASSQCRQLGP